MDAQDGDGRPLDEALAENRASFVAALAGGDAKGAAAVYARNARLLAPSAELVRGSEAIEAFWRAGLESGIRAAELEAVELERHDGLAYEIGRYALQLEPAEGGTVVDRGKYLLVHERQEDGSWRWAVEMFNPDAPAATAATTTTQWKEHGDEEEASGHARGLRGSGHDGGGGLGDRRAHDERCQELHGLPHAGRGRADQDQGGELTIVVV